MGVIEAARGVLWARRRQPDQTAYVVELSHERFPPTDLVRQAVEAEEAGFDGVCCSDHLAPWWVPDEPTPAACGNAWVWLGAVGQATERVALGTGVTSVVHRYNPVVLAQQLATLEELCPGRAFLGVGSGEAMNEVPAGMDWPQPSEQLARTAEALEIITRLLAGETVTFEGHFFRTRDARLYLRTERRPPVFMSAFGPQAAAIAGRFADGVWTLADPRKAPPVIASYRRAAEEAGRVPGEIILQGLVAWAETDQAALDGCREFKPTLVDANYVVDLHTPGHVGSTGEKLSDIKFETMGIISSDPATHVRKVKMLGELGATVVVLMNVSGADPHGTLRAYGREVLPELRG
jgi:coenzyme F420-dependent glucose-6-phosphate dehydrogenase